MTKTTRTENIGFFLNILSLIMLMGIAGAVENLPPEAGMTAWLFVLAEVIGAAIVGLIGTKMILKNNDRGH